MSKSQAHTKIQNTPGLEMTPRCLQDGRKMAQHSSKMAQNGPEIATGWPKDGQILLQDGPGNPSMTPNGSKMIPKWQNGLGWALQDC